jgi:two-component system response regulator FixJ
MANPPSPVVHIVDDDDSVRQVLALIFETAGHNVVAHDSAETFLASLNKPADVGDGPACVVTDVRMPGMDGLDLLDTLREHDPELPVLVITAHGDMATAVRALRSGAADFFEKPFDADALLDSLNRALERRQRSAGRRQAIEDARERVGRLTAREREVMEMIAEGRSNAAAAQTLGISIRTVENHRARLMEKLGVGGLSDLVRLQILVDGTEA